MKWFWQKRPTHKAIEGAPARAMEMIRRVEITVEEDWIAGVVQRPGANNGGAPADDEQRIVPRPELPPSTEGNSRVR